MSSSKSASEKGSQGLSGNSWKAPLCKDQRGPEEEKTSGFGDTPVEKPDTIAGSGKGTAQPPPYKYDRLPSLDDEPAGGLRYVGNASAKN